MPVLFVQRYNGSPQTIVSVIKPSSTPRPGQKARRIHNSNAGSRLHEVKNMQIPLYAVFDKQINLCSPHAQQCVGHLLQAVRSVHRVSGSRGKCQIRGLNPRSTATVYNSKAVHREDEVETMQKSLSSGEAQIYSNQSQYFELNKKANGKQGQTSIIWHADFTCKQCCFFRPTVVRSDTRFIHIHFSAINRSQEKQNCPGKPYSCTGMSRQYLP
ncbi:hypothetical protein Anapl_11520 [Anas platyrhynchos]|uniref:Uncharacterized protein n=1 Tax=Anas platyrhynchos TaxID=8839 RepID=R0LHN5_ANAPL|nr:hypothetical protein Anapl_11520 [Anas platyrhynchos]